MTTRQKYLFWNYETTHWYLEDEHGTCYAVITVMQLPSVNPVLEWVLIILGVQPPPPKDIFAWVLTMNRSIHGKEKDIETAQYKARIAAMQESFV